MTAGVYSWVKMRGGEGRVEGGCSICGRGWRGGMVCCSWVVWGWMRVVSEVRVVGILLDLVVSLWSVCGGNRWVGGYVRQLLVNDTDILRGVTYIRSS